LPASGQAGQASSRTPDEGEADGEKVAKHVCRARCIVPLRSKRRGGRRNGVMGSQSSNFRGRSGAMRLRTESVRRREIPRLRVPALRAKAKARDTSLGMTFLYAGAGVFDA